MSLKRQAEDSASPAAKKPIFLAKAQREQLALQRRLQETGQKKCQDLLLLSHVGSSDSDNNSIATAAVQSTRERDWDRERERGRERERSSRREEERERERARLEKLAEKEREKVLEAIREHRLGWKKPKKQVVKARDKFRFAFDWDNTEDTSGDVDLPLHQNPHGALPLFGRGRLAGIDRQEQKELVAKISKEIPLIRRKDDAFDMPLDTHWSEKKLDEMTERDWRIFREDFYIGIH